MRKIIIILFIFIYILLLFPVHANESVYSTSISRMEKEWLNKEFPNEDDDVRISRLEETVFGAIQDIDINSRYTKLRKAFDAKKVMQVKHHSNYLYSSPTSIPMNVNDLLGY